MHDCIGIEFSRLNLCFVLQNLKTCRKLRRGAMVMNKQGEGFSWLASGNMPFTIEHRFSTDGLSSALSLLGYIGRLDLSGDLHYTEGTAASEQVQRTLVDDRHAAQRKSQKLKHIPKAKRSPPWRTARPCGRSEPWWSRPPTARVTKCMEWGCLKTPMKDTRQCRCSKCSSSSKRGKEQRSNINQPQNHPPAQPARTLPPPPQALHSPAVFTATHGRN